MVQKSHTEEYSQTLATEDTPPADCETGAARCIAADGVFVIADMVHVVTRHEELRGERGARASPTTRNTGSQRLSETETTPSNEEFRGC